MADQKNAAQPEVTLKPDAVEVKQDEQAKKPALPPYHTEETAKIAEQRAKQVEKQADKPYEFSANGYTVKQRKADEQERSFADEGGFVYDVTAEDGDFPKRVYGQKREAEVFAETHAPHFTKMSATQPSV